MFGTKFSYARFTWLQLCSVSDFKTDFRLKYPSNEDLLPKNLRHLAGPCGTNERVIPSSNPNCDVLYSHPFYT
jgi:hypothetical protein